MIDIDNEIRTLITFFLAVVFVSAALIFPLPWNEAAYVVQKVGNVERLIWFGTGIATALWSRRLTGSASLGSTLMMIFFGPVVGITMVLYWLSLKLIPRRNNGT